MKPETVYAYVSRGQLSSRRDPAGRGSTFDAKEVDALVRKGRREPSAGSDVTQRIRTGITLIDKDRYYFRGVDATELARSHSYEEVADWLWTGTLHRGIRFTSPPEPLAAARRAVESLPDHSGSTDRLRVAAIAAAVADPLRFDLGRDAVLGSARSLIPVLVDALPTVGEPHRGEGRLAWRLWSRLTATRPDEAFLRALDMALSLLIDHDLAASTLAVRVAASARAHPYAVVSAGLGALDGPLHGAASGLAHRMLADVLERGGAAPVVADHLRAGRRVPGLGHRLYPAQDPRAEALFGALEQTPGCPSGAGGRSRGGVDDRPPCGAARQCGHGARRALAVVGHAGRGGRDRVRRGAHGRLDRPCAGGVRGAAAADAAERSLQRTPPAQARAVKRRERPGRAEAHVRQNRSALRPPER